ncbi:MAG: hypothetical protein C6P36_02850 [Geobacillus sp.]|nr:MAG: hypothetical protein C6P36_02850 [Geobacillus sp.]
MSAQEVFEKMKRHYLATGNIMKGQQFICDIATKFYVEDVIEGIMHFNQFLDEQREMNDKNRLELAEENMCDMPK